VTKRQIKRCDSLEKTQTGDTASKRFHDCILGGGGIDRGKLMGGVDKVGFI
jgi:hypothetical protein